ncbi:MAG: glycoside hydrolase TIM-barrel-like domain-containing protein [Rickettsiales bacterium]|nr:glycoside hydrolase TIM-barrel-like domain-containing protein [Rickettsiales bacterium]
MASIVLGNIGSALGAATGIPFASQIGRQLASSLATTKLPDRYGARLVDFAVQTSTYGKMIPMAYGVVRLGGNIIWSRPIQELATTTTTTSSGGGGGGKGGGGRVSQTSTTYSYSVSLAIAICEGPIDEVLRIWADAAQLDVSKYTLRMYTGSETQFPDSYIQSYEGSGNTPAYRGLAYVVIEDFPLEDFGNRIPNFTFEVKRKMQSADYNGESLENMVTAITLIPGSGEFVYDTELAYKIPGIASGASWVQQGSQQVLNMHNASGKSNLLLSLDQLADTCPNVEWVSVVVAWFGTSTDVATCDIVPGVEYQIGGITSPDSWEVAGFDRASAHLITQISGSPQYGGTPDDDSIVRCLTELQNRGYKVLFYPLIFLDTSGKPWRGTLTGAASDMATFFTKTNGYNAFINHYANLVDGLVDAFAIGSEMVGLTKVTDTPGNYPAVTQLVSLAAAVKTTLGGSVKVTYAADWSEYHHTDGGWYNLDPLWSSSNIDVIGIDAYFPLTDEPQNGYDVDAVKAGWTSGEGYSFYYSDPARTTQAPLSAPYAWKNIDWFWNNTHVNPNSVATNWVPQSKKIWFTEFGFPSVDGATNQPNVFYDPSSTSSALPYHSKGRVDFRAQRVGLTATYQQWESSSMIERMFLWTWDARPYPYWPDLVSVWSDGGVWKTGHWVQGKLGISSLATILSDLCVRSGLDIDDIEVGGITDLIEGYIIGEQQTVRQAIESLQQAFFFDVVESDHVLKFTSRGKDSQLTIDEEDLIPTAESGSQRLLDITRAQEIELPKRVNVVFLNRLLNYQSATQYAQREVTSSLETDTISLPVVLSDQAAKTIADITLFTRWVGRTSYSFDLPVQYATLEPGDVITIATQGHNHTMRIVNIRTSTPNIISVDAVADSKNAYDFYTAPGVSGGLLQENSDIPQTELQLLDTVAFPADDSDKGYIRMAASGLSDRWTGSAIYRSDDGGANFLRITDITTPAITGSALSVLGNGPYHIFDTGNTLDILLLGDDGLQSATEIAVLNGANAALVGDEIIQFKTATLTGSGRYTLSGLLRGRLGTEWAMGTHVLNERFVLLDARLSRLTQTNNLIGLPRQYKGVSFGNTLSDATAQSFTYSGVALKPYAPVHIHGTRDGSSNLTISWLRRSRLSPGWLDGVDVPLNEASEAYEVDIMDGGDVARTITGLSSATASYSAANQTTDFGSPQSSLTVKIYQLSAVVGRGYAGTATI